MDEYSQVRTQCGDSGGEGGGDIVLLLGIGVLAGIGVGVTIAFIIDKMKRIKTPWGEVEFKD